MNSLDSIQQAFASHVKAIFNECDSSVISPLSVRLQLNVDEARQGFGDLTTSIAMTLAKQLHFNPQHIAQKIALFSHYLVKKVEVAGPGFINIYLTDQAFKDFAAELHDRKEKCFKPDFLPVVYSYSIEFVSANPTGPLHFGHGRGGIIGDVLSNILRFVGHTVTKEFYINDAGNQIQKLGESFKIRCLQAAGFDLSIPEDGYHGDYLVDLAQGCFADYGNALFEKPVSYFTEYAKSKMLEQIKNTLQEYGIVYDVWFSEKTLHDEGKIGEAIAVLQKNQLLFEQEGALWFRTTSFGDDKDRVIRKATGEYTYIAAGIVYLKNKVDRGFNNLVFVLGHDHHSYVSRLNAVKNGLGFEQIPLDVILYQLVKITDKGELVRMSKRSGATITLQDIINTVGKDVARFFYLNRKADAQLEFDLDLALKKTEENPVYYVQNAYVRIGSVLARASLIHELANITIDDANYIGEQEMLLLKKIMVLEQLMYDISVNHQTHLLTYYVVELAQLFHRYYGNVRVLDLNDIPKSRSRLLMIMLVRTTLSTVLELLGISCPEKM